MTDRGAVVLIEQDKVALIRRVPSGRTEGVRDGFG